MHATGTLLLLYYMGISIVCLFTMHDIDHHVVLVHLHLTLHSILPHLIILLILFSHGAIKLVQNPALRTQVQPALEYYGYEV